CYCRSSHGPVPETMCGWDNRNGRRRHNRHLVPRPGLSGKIPGEAGGQNRRSVLPEQVVRLDRTERMPEQRQVGWPPARVREQARSGLRGVGRVETKAGGSESLRCSGAGLRGLTVAAADLIVTQL